LSEDSSSDEAPYDHESNGDSDTPPEPGGSVQPPGVDRAREEANEEKEYGRESSKEGKGVDSREVRFSRTAAAMNVKNVKNVKNGASSQYVNNNTCTMDDDSEEA